MAATVHISVLGSFHPVQLQVQPAAGSILVVQTQERTVSVQGSHSRLISGPARVSGRSGGVTRFKLAIPGRVEREYLGRLEIRRQGNELLAIVEMDRETAVASIMEAEGASAMPLEARKAQAIVIRSYLAGAHDRHQGYDFCDTTHCQLLGSVAKTKSVAAHSAESTRDQVLVYKNAVVPAVYSADCGGRTKTLTQAGWDNAGSVYPFFAIACPRPKKGRASGHGIGLCQMGAIEIAKHGWPARLILRHYFPETTIETIGSQPTRTSALLTANVGRGVHAIQ